MLVLNVHVRCLSKPGLVRHMATHSGTKDHQCCKCGKMFARPHDLRKHEQSHEEEPETYLCFICGKTFDHKKNYHAHIGTHTRRQHGGRPTCKAKDSSETSNLLNTSDGRISSPTKFLQCSECQKCSIEFQKKISP